MAASWPREAKAKAKAMAVVREVVEATAADLENGAAVAGGSVPAVVHAGGVPEAAREDAGIAVGAVGERGVAGAEGGKIAARAENEAGTERKIVAEVDRKRRVTKAIVVEVKRDPAAEVRKKKTVAEVKRKTAAEARRKTAGVAHARKTRIGRLLVVAAIRAKAATTRRKMATMMRRKRSKMATWFPRQSRLSLIQWASHRNMSPQLLLILTRSSFSTTVKQFSHAGWNDVLASVDML